MQKQEGIYVQFLNKICNKIGKTGIKNIEQQYATILDNLINMTYKDHLTKLFNRRYFEEELEKEMHRFERYGYIFSLCMMDINGFKQINDTHGHLKGDEILKDFADILRKNSRTSDILCRWGGDEFAVILPHTTFSKIEPYIKKILSALKTPEDGILINTAIGATSIRLNDDKDSLLKRADEALYKAKKDESLFYIL
ncbi:GGDEF domain protein [Desulfurella amilsii]|uniref:diguanylate cyclase n=1 Tax=Desulfurella amilsii TaxID=1562698 RepID=A0A1X4XWF7_9BACT|nr:GGDEF domain-containing protein [Desulfurella amilsii]OSS41870.1 GGDEF domain protein [Desulfurella amilsii]